MKSFKKQFIECCKNGTCKEIKCPECGKNFIEMDDKDFVI